jgi:hypothetical protein
MIAPVKIPAFPGDDNELLIRIQDSTEDQAGSLYFRPQRRFLRSADLLGMDSAFVQKVRAAQSVELWRLKPIFASIAAVYRFKSQEAAQQELGSTAAAHEERLERDWLGFYHAEVDELTADDRFTLAVVKLVAGSPEEQHHAEIEVEDALFKRYGELQHKARKIHRAGKPSQEQDL